MVYIGIKRKMDVNPGYYVATWGGGGTHPYLVRDVWLVEVVSGSHFDRKMKVIPSKGHFRRRQKNKKRPEKQ